MPLHRLPCDRDPAAARRACSLARQALLVGCTAALAAAASLPSQAQTPAPAPTSTNTSANTSTSTQAPASEWGGLFKGVEAAAARTDNPALKYHLGMLLNNGIGTPRDLPRAYTLFSEAAAAGDALAAYKVGCYLAGQFPGVVPLDEAQALAFKQRAAEAGYDLAQHDVAVLLMKRGDRAGAQAWLERASHQGHLPSTAALAGLAEQDKTDPVRALGLALVVQAGVRNPPVALTDRVATLRAGLDEAGRQRAEALQAGWVTGPTALTQQARAGLRAVAPLLPAAASGQPL